MNIGILGGTFDPVHLGHVFIAERARQLFFLDQVWFMVANIPPHKEKGSIGSPFHRYAMTVLALQKHRRLRASAWELERSGPSFTVETLDQLSRCRPQDRFCFIAGSDSLRDLHSWKDYDKLLLQYGLVFVQRPGEGVNLETLSLPGRLKEVIENVCPVTKRPIQPGRSFLIDINPPPFSSTSVREAIAAGRPPASGCLAPAVLAYIGKYRLYEQDSSGTQEGL